MQSVHHRIESPPPITFSKFSFRQIDNRESAKMNAGMISGAAGASTASICTSTASITTSSTRAASRKSRVYVFREFLFQVYGDYLTQSALVLDVAGGKGDLSWLLRNVDDIDSVVVDPRITKNHIEKSVRYLEEHPEEVKIRSIPDKPTYQPLAALMVKLGGKKSFQSPRHLRLFFDSRLIEAIRHYKVTKAITDWEKYWTEATIDAVNAQPLGYKEIEQNDDPSSVSSSTRQRQKINDASVALKTLLDTKLIMGFHPDQATEPIVDLALELEIPFCIVPCCVFPSEFPNRHLPDGRKVRTYMDFMEYLELKSSDIKTATLPFHFTQTSKNLALYTLPPSSSSLPPPI